MPPVVPLCRTQRYPGTFDHPEREYVMDDVIIATLPLLPLTLQAMIKLQRLTGMPSPTKDEPRNRFWKTKLAAMGRNEIVQTFSRPLVYRNGIGQEKGINVRLALDAVRLAHENEPVSHSVIIPTPSSGAS